MKYVQQTGMTVVFLLMFMSSHAQTARQKEIDETFRNCVTKDTTYANISNCAFVAYAKWDKEMADAYKKLMHEQKNKRI